MSIRKLFITGAVGALIGTGSLIAATAPASAFVACNRAGECWHTDYRDYRPAFGVTIHDDNWRWRDRDHFRWREHAGRGYWRNGIWITL